MATERITIIVSQTGAVTVKKDIADIGPAAKSSATAVDQLKGALAAYIGLQAAQKLGELADAGTRLTNSLKQSGLSGQALVDQQEKLFDIATKNGQSVNELAGIYQKLTSVQGQLEASGQDVDKVMNGIAASMKLSSASSAAQAGSLQQLSQLFGGVNVQAQEYNSLIDGAYPLLQAVAAGSDRFRGSVSALTQAVKASSVTTKEFFDALVKGSDVNIALAASFNVTIGQALTNFNTKLIQLVLYINQTTGAFNGVANAINFVAQNLGVLLAILSPIIAGFTLLAVQVIGGYFISAMKAATIATGTLITALSRLLLLLIANPAVAGLVLIAATVATIITVTGKWEDAIQTVIDAINTAIIAVKNLLTLFGATFTNGQFEIKVTGQEFVSQFKTTVADMRGALPAGANQAAPTLRKAVADGGNDAATALKLGTAEASQAIYEALNGVPTKLLGAIQTGADYTYNQITGAVERSIPLAGNQAGTAMQNAIIAGGNTAASAMGAAVAGAGREATIQLNQALAAQQSALTGKRSIEQGLGYIPGGSGTGPIFQQQNIGRGSSLSPVIQAQLQREAANKNLQGEYTSQVGGGAVNVNNYVSPSDALTAIDTKEGNKTVINVIKSNASEVKAILGIN